jgi:hypothetical protein
MDMMQLGLLRNSFKFLVIDTGYTSRLIEDVDDIEEKIKKRFKSSRNGKDDCQHCQNRILYIRGNYDEHYANDQREKECEYVKRTINDRSGAIVLRCEK